MNWIELNWMICIVWNCWRTFCWLHIFNESDLWFSVCCNASFRFSSNRQHLIHKSMELLNKIVLVQCGMLCWQSVSHLHLIWVTRYSWYLGQSTQCIRYRHRALDETNKSQRNGWISGPGPWKILNCSADNNIAQHSRPLNHLRRCTMHTRRWPIFRSTLTGQQIQPQLSARLHLQLCIGPKANTDQA